MTTLPTHPDFSLILQSIADGDDLCEEVARKPLHEIEHGDAEWLMGHLADIDSVNQAAAARVRHVLATLPIMVLLAAPEVAMAALWTDAFVTGVRFQQLGGHTA